jgi:hypothetical protein
MSRAHPFEKADPFEPTMPAPDARPSRAEHLEVPCPASTREGRHVLKKTEVRSAIALCVRS